MKKNSFVVICTFIVFVLSIIFGVFFIKSNDEASKDNNIMLLENKVIEYGTVFEYDEFIDILFINDENNKIKDVEVSIEGRKVLENENIVFESLGDITVKATYTYRDKEESQSVIFEVKDTKEPKLRGIENLEITLGEKLNYQENIKAYDDCDGNVEVTFEGEVDETRVGRYRVKVLASDKSGNIASEVFYITIKDNNIVTTTTKTTKKTTSTKKSSTSKITQETTTKKTTTTVKNDASTKQGRLALAKAEAKKVIKSIIKPGMSDAEKAQAISSFLYYNVDRQTNQSTEAYKTNFGNEAYAALVMRIAACSGFCKAVTLLCNEAGLKSEHVNANKWTHQWNRVYVDGKWQVLDAQLGYFGGEKHPYLE